MLWACLSLTNYRSSDHCSLRGRFCFWRFGIIKASCNPRDPLHRSNVSFCLKYNAQHQANTKTLNTEIPTSPLRSETTACSLQASHLVENVTLVKKSGKRDVSAPTLLWLVLYLCCFCFFTIPLLFFNKRVYIDVYVCGLLHSWFSGD